jgi:glycosyltransferase involved in cell wall biosynthesis
VRILYLTDNNSNHNHRFLEKWVSFGYEVFFLDVTQDGSGQSLPADVREVKTRKYVSRDSPPSKFAEFLSEFQSLLKEIRPDVVQAGPVQTCGYVAALSGFHPLLVMSWGSDMLLHGDRNAEWTRATEVALRAADGFFCDCEAVRTSVQRYAEIPNSQIAQFPWGIERGSFSPQGATESREKLGIRPSDFAFISTRSWEPLYDTTVLLEAFNTAYRKNQRLRLLLLGHGSAAPSVRSFIAEHQLNQVVITPGLIASRETPRWFRAANAYISCARWDGTSISMLEAMATGLPAIVTDIASNREWVTESQNGWLASTGSAEAFADKILRCASLSAEDLASIGERNQQIVAERADWDKNFPGLVRLCQRLISGALVMEA